MRGISLPVMSQLDKWCPVRSSLRRYTWAGQPTHDNGSKFGLIGSDVMIWWFGQSIMGTTECVGVGERERERERDIESKGNQGNERGESETETESESESEREHETVREVENFGSWRYAVWRHVQLRIVYMPPVLTIPLSTTYPHPLPKYRPAIILLLR